MEGGKNCNLTTNNNLIPPVVDYSHNNIFYIYNSFSFISKQSTTTSKVDADFFLSRQYCVTTINMNENNSFKKCFILWLL